MLGLSYRQGNGSSLLFQQGKQARKLIEQATHLRKQWLGVADAPVKCISLRAEHSAVYGQSLHALTNFINYIKQHDIQTVVHLGIGGSMLGPELVYGVLSYDHVPQVNNYFISSFDARLNKLLPTLDLTKTVFVVVSKSFGTDEVLWQWAQVQNHLQNSQQASHAFAITSCPEKAEQAGFAMAHILKIPEDVGGRFSVWSAVSASIVAAFGLDVFKDFLAGAAMVDNLAASDDAKKNMPLAMALQAYDCLQNKKLPTRAICAYHPALEKLVNYLQQLEMESLGKYVGLNDQPIEGLTCPVIWGGLGTNLQHSVFQYLMQSGLKTPIDFISVQGEGDSHQKYRDHLQAQLSILDNGFASAEATEVITPNPDYQLLEMQDLSAKSLGALLAIYEHKVVWLAGMLGLDPFTQPGVQAAKLQLKYT